MIAAEMFMRDEGAGRPPAGGLGETADGAGADTLNAVLDVMRTLRACEHDYVAGLVHDGPMQDLAVLALELGTPNRDMPDGILRQVNGVGRGLSRIQDELCPFPPPGGGLIETLRQRTAWLLESPLAVAVGDGAAALLEADVQTVSDVAELVLTGLGAAGAWDGPTVLVMAGQGLIVLELNMTPKSASGQVFNVPAAAAWLNQVAAATQIRTSANLDQRRLRIRVEIPRRPDGRPGAQPEAHLKEALKRGTRW